MRLATLRPQFAQLAPNYDEKRRQGRAPRSITIECNGTRFLDGRFTCGAAVRRSFDRERKPHGHRCDGGGHGESSNRLQSIRDSDGVRHARETRFWENRRARHMLTEKAFCGICGGPLAAIGADHLACGKARGTGTCDNRRSICRGGVEELILNALKDQLMEPVLVAAFIDEFLRKVNRQRQTLSQHERRRGRSWRR
jgi:hypothetical protein